MSDDRHLATGIEPVWVRIKYRWSGTDVEEVTPMEFRDWVDEDRAEYECSCGEVMGSYDAMIEHLERANTGRTFRGRE